MFGHKWTNVTTISTGAYASHYATNGRFRTKIGALMAAFVLSDSREVETVRINSL